MLARLGNVLYWLGCIVAVAVLSLDVALWIGESDRRSSEIGLFVFVAVVAVAIWLIGRACRYVLSGK
jgi:hypothetical protein